MSEIRKEREKKLKEELSKKTAQEQEKRRLQHEARKVQEAIEAERKRVDAEIRKVEELQLVEKKKAEEDAKKAQRLAKAGLSLLLKNDALEKNSTKLSRKNSRSSPSRGRSRSPSPKKERHRSRERHGNNRRSRDPENSRRKSVEKNALDDLNKSGENKRHRGDEETGSRKKRKHKEEFGKHNSPHDQDDKEKFREENNGKISEVNIKDDSCLQDTDDGHADFSEGRFINHSGTDLQWKPDYSDSDDEIQKPSAALEPSPKSDTMICASNASPRESDITFGSHSPRATNLPRAPSTIIPHPINTPHFTDNTPRATDTFNDKKSRESIKASYQNADKEKKRRPIKHTRKKIGKQCPRDREWTNTKKETGVKADTEDPKKKTPT